MEFGLPRGLRDILPEEFERAEVMRTAFIETCRLFGYRMMEPSPLELVETLEAKSGPAIRDEIYFFRDKAERELGLRFDLTLGITRYVASRRDLPLPVRLAAYSSVWRYEEPQYGKYRWFYQWDAELFGPKENAEADAEIVEFSASLFRSMGVDTSISLGSRKVIESYIRDALGIDDERRILDLLRGVDKLSKKSEDEVAREYASSFSREDLGRLIDFVSGKAQHHADAAELRNLAEITDSLRSRGVANVQIDLRIARGLDYYTDMVFEAFDRNNAKLGALCGGGRYDSLPGIYGAGEELGATGVAGGIERAMLALESQGSPRAARADLRVFVAPVGGDREVVRAAAAIAAELRSAGIPCQSELTGRSLRKILEAQSAAGTPTVIVVGERELATGSLKVRWMKENREDAVPRSELVRVISGSS